MPKLNTEQFKILKQYKDEQWDLHSNIHDSLIPLITEDIKQIRELTKDIAIIAGAIAAFTIPVINTQLIYTKPLAYLALFLLFSTIMYAIYHLSDIIPKELNGLVKQQTVYSKVVVDSINRINKVFEDGNINHIIDFDKEKILKELDELKEDINPDKSLDVLRILLGSSMIFILLSFFNYQPLIDYLNRIIYSILNVH